MSSELWAGGNDVAASGDIIQVLWGCGRALRYVSKVSVGH